MSESDPFIKYLESHRDDRAMLASLRRGMGQAPGTVAAVSRVVQPWLGVDAPAWREDAYYLIAPLFAFHPVEGASGNMGHHFRAMCDPGGDPPPNIERRFMTLLECDPDDLDDVLRQAIALLKSRGIPVNWHELWHDVQEWKHPNEERRIRIKKQWSRGFWRAAQPAPATNSDPVTPE